MKNIHYSIIRMLSDGLYNRLAKEYKLSESDTC
jgi:hypothetical protein